MARVLMGLAYGFILCAGNSIHSLGHIIGGTILKAPLNALLLTPTGM